MACEMPMTNHGMLPDEEKVADRMGNEYNKDEQLVAWIARMNEPLSQEVVKLN